MGRLVKFLLIVVASIIGAGMLASVILYLFVDVNTFRDEISAAVEKETGRELVIEGDISLSIFPWIALEIGRTELGNAPGFGDAPMLSFENTRLSVRFLPLLLRREIAVGTASLDGLVVNLAISANGTGNWEDLVAAGSSDPVTVDEAPASGGGAIRLDIANVRVSDASLSFRDLQGGAAHELTGLTISTGRIAAGTPFDVDAEFDFNSMPAKTGGHLSISGTLTLAEDLQQLSVDDLNMNGELTGIVEESTGFNFDARAISLDMAGQRMNLGEMDLAVLGLTMAADVQPFSYAGTPQPKMALRVNEFSLKDLLQTLGAEPPQTSDDNALQRVSFSANAALGEDALSLDTLTLQLDDTTLTGELSIPLAETGTLRFDLNADSISVDPYMAPAGSGEAEGAAPSDDEVEIPAELIRALNMSGTLRLGQALLSGMTFDNMQLGVNAADGKLRLHPVSAELFDGTYEGDVRIDASGDTPSISVNEKIAGVSLASLAKTMFDQDNVTGTINGTFALGGSGGNLAAIRQDLDGSMAFELIDGAFEGTDVWHQLRSARALFKQEAPPEPRLPAKTEFTSVTATGTVTDGVFSNSDLLAELPFLQLTGSGTVDFTAANMDYVMEARVIEQPEFVDPTSDAELADFTAAVIPLKISGPLASPRVAPDIELLVRREVERQVEEKKEELKDEVLRRIFGDEQEGSAEETAEDDAESEQLPEEEEEQSAEDQVKDALKELLGR